MSSSFCRSWLGWTILVPCLTGCSLFGTQGPPHDPLFLSKTPMSARAEFAPPVALAYLEPSLPRDPFLAQNAPALADKNGPSVPGRLTSQRKEQE